MIIVYNHSTNRVETLTEIVGGSGGGSGKAETLNYFQETQPTNPQNGQTWFNTVDSKIYTYKDGQWDKGKTPTIGTFYLYDNKYYTYNGATLVENEISKKKYVVGEEVLIGEWVEDGITYDLYRKVINIGPLPDSTQANYRHNITNKHQFVYIYGFAKGQSNWLTIPNAAPGTNNNIYLAVGNNNITIATGSNRTSYNGYIVLEYTRVRNS